MADRWRRLQLVVEGRTELFFVGSVLKPHLETRRIEVMVSLVTTRRRRSFSGPSKGGATSYAQIRNELLKHLRRRDVDAVSTMFDLYGLPSDFPGYSSASRSLDPVQRAEMIEDEIARDIKSTRTFLPYIQVHEFEALLLSDASALRAGYPESSRQVDRAIQLLTRERTRFRTPEHIDDDKPPSRRIDRHLPGYCDAKARIGPIVAQRIGLSAIRRECKHFDAWLAKLEHLAHPDCMRT